MSVHCRVPPGSDAPAASAATAPAAAASQGKPSLRRIKGRIHRSKSLDSIDLLDCNVSRFSACRDDVIQSFVFFTGGVGTSIEPVLRKCHQLSLFGME